MIEDYSAYCEDFYNANSVPAAIWQNGRITHVTGFEPDYHPYSAVTPALLDGSELPTVFTAKDSGLYGAVALDEDTVLLIGPVYSIPVTKATLHELTVLAAIPAGQMTAVKEMVLNTPRFTYHRFLQLLSFLQHSLHGESVQPEHYKVSTPGYEEIIAERQTSVAYENEGEIHGTWAFEQRMFSLIRHGQPERLRQFLLDSVKSERMNEGHLAENALRQSKNVLIGLVSCVGKFSAIPGGMDVEETYQLIDAYTRECERLKSVDAIRNLQFNMLIDFAARVAAGQLPDNISPLVYSCVQFISSRVNEPISLMDVVAFSGISRAGLCGRFKKETGYSIGEYIIMCRIREAKDLLRYTDKSIAEISSYLCFSSQSYFQSLFKKEAGLTPYQYRRSRRGE